MTNYYNGLILTTTATEIDTSKFNSISSFAIDADVPDGTALHFAFKMNDGNFQTYSTTDKAWKDITGDVTADNIAKVGNTLAEVQALTSTEFAPFVGTKVNLAIALTMDTSQMNVPTIKSVKFVGTYREGYLSDARMVGAMKDMSGEIFQDGTVKWKVEKIDGIDGLVTSAETDGGLVTLTRMDGSTSQLQLVADNAAAHNAIYRGKDLTAYFDSGEMSKAIADGTFSNIFIGDYIDKSFVSPNGGDLFNVRWRIAHIDYYLYKSYKACTTHHVVVVPDDVLDINICMNSSGTTSGGYVGSEMWKTTLPKYAANIRSAFGAEHILTHGEMLTNDTDADAVSAVGQAITGCSTNMDCYDVYANNMSEQQVYGSTGWISHGLDIGEATSQFRLFDLDPSSQIAGYRGIKNATTRKGYWLRAVVTKSYFAYANANGFPIFGSPSSQYVEGGIRPFFLLY